VKIGTFIFTFLVQPYLFDYNLNIHDNRNLPVREREAD